MGSLCVQGCAGSPSLRSIALLQFPRSASRFRHQQPGPDVFAVWSSVSISSRVYQGLACPLPGARLGRCQPIDRRIVWHSGSDAPPAVPGYRPCTDRTSSRPARARVRGSSHRWGWRRTVSPGRGDRLERDVAQGGVHDHAGIGRVRGRSRSDSTVDHLRRIWS